MRQVEATAKLRGERGSLFCVSECVLCTENSEDNTISTLRGTVRRSLNTSQEFFENQCFRNLVGETLSWYSNK